MGIEHPDAPAALDYPFEADAADVAEQEQPVDDADLDAPAALDYPLEADAADVAEQHREIPLDEEGAR